MTTKGLVEDAVLYIPRNTIHADPDQPRVKVDQELQASIDESGIIQAITVRPHPEIEDEWMIVDGERRYLGGAHLKTIPCRIRLDLEEPVDRLITQLSANTGKPLSPIEQARAFKKALDADPKLSQAELAKRLGIPRTTIGDRIRLIEIHPAWMKLIESGHLQVSHAPAIHQYRAVPDEYQVKAATSVAETDEDYVIRVDDMRKALYRAFRDYVIRLDKVSSYKGPVLEIDEESWQSSGGTRIRKVKYAADIRLWRPIRNAAERRRKKEQKTSGGSSPHFAPRTKPIEVAIKLLGDRVKVKTTTAWQIKAGPGENEIFEADGWVEGLDPEVLSAQLVADDLVIRESQGGTRKIFTTNRRAIEIAQQSFEQKLLAKVEPSLKKIREKLTPALLAKHEISGPGVRTIVATLLFGDSFDDGDTQRTLRAVALAVADKNLPDNQSFDYQTKITDVLKEIEDCSDETLGAILTALGAALTLKGSLPDLGDQRREIESHATKVPFSFRDAKSKKLQKREARAAGKQVGDPKRAKKEKEVPIAAAFDVDAEDDALEADYEIVDGPEQFEEANA